MADTYLVWSHEHGAWWRGVNGYTLNLNEAGRFTSAAALKICIHARGGWRPGDPPPEIPVRLEDAQAVEDSVLRPANEKGRTP